MTGTGDSAAQYMNYMNIFFTAQKMTIPIDICKIMQDSGLLQQGSDITGGTFLKVEQLGGLLQYLSFFKCWQMFMAPKSDIILTPYNIICDATVVIQFL